MRKLRLSKEQTTRVSGGAGFYRPPVNKFSVSITDGNFVMVYNHNKRVPLDFINGKVDVYESGKKVATSFLKVKPYSGKVTFHSLELVIPGSLSLPEFSEKYKAVKGFIIKAINGIANNNKADYEAEACVETSDEVVEQSGVYTEEERQQKIDSLNEAKPKEKAASKKTLLNAPSQKAKSSGKRYATPLWKGVSTDKVTTYERKGHWRTLPSGEKRWIKPTLVHKAI